MLIKKHGFSLKRCPEYDTWEGNKHTMSVALHKCDGNPGNWWQCDRHGCGTNAHEVDQNMMCPESRCKINTNKPFTVSHYQTDNVINAWFWQEGRTASFNACNNQWYIKQQADQGFDGMTFTASLWGDPNTDMNWLDGMTGCQGVCNMNHNTKVTFSNFQNW